jgi:peptidoglycan/xylan/chitin deacetylase (PgdA/CDA1 family)
MRLRRLRLGAGSLLRATAMDRLSMLGQRIFWGRHYLRAVNYHDVPPSCSANFERQLAYYKRHFSPAGLDDLDRFFTTGRWHQRKPGLILAFDDGLRFHHDVAAPLLEQYGFVGWFFVPPAFAQAPPQGQKEFARKHKIQFAPENSDRIAMSSEEVRDLAQRHVVGCHTLTHSRLCEGTPENQLADEVVASKALLERWLGKEVVTFCWVGGEESSYSACAARAIQAAGFRYAFMTNAGAIRPGHEPMQLQRVNIEADWPLSLLCFQLCGAVDAAYTLKRRRVNRVTRLRA